MKYNGHINLQYNELRNAKIREVDGVPDDLEEGELAYDPATDTLYGRNAKGVIVFEEPPPPPFDIYITAGRYHSGCKAQDGTAWSWGFGASFGSLGAGTGGGSQASPISVVGDHIFTTLRYGDYCSAALKEDGSAWTWGANHHGQLGDNTAGTSSHRSSPVSVVGGYIFTQISNVSRHALALKENGSCWAWGYNDYGELGRNNVWIATSSPVSVVGNHSFIQVSIGLDQNSFALKADGSAWAWGRGDLGALGQGWHILNRSSPTSVVGNHSFIQVSGGGYGCAGLKANGSVWAWGQNTWGQLGDNTIIHRSSPISVVGGHSFVYLSKKARIAVALKADGSAWCWGNNFYGSLGDNTTSFRSSPVSVVGNHSFVQVSSGFESHVLAIKEDGSGWGWGSNHNGQLGNGTTSSNRGMSSPVSVIRLFA